MTPHPDREGEFVAPYGCIVTFEESVLSLLCEKCNPLTPKLVWCSQCGDNTSPVHRGKPLCTSCSWHNRNNRCWVRNAHGQVCSRAAHEDGPHQYPEKLKGPNTSRISIDMDDVLRRFKKAHGISKVMCFNCAAQAEVPANRKEWVKSFPEGWTTNVLGNVLCSSCSESWRIR